MSMLIHANTKADKMSDIFRKNDIGNITMRIPRSTSDTLWSVDDCEYVVRYIYS